MLSFLFFFLNPITFVAGAAAEVTKHENAQLNCTVQLRTAPATAAKEAISERICTLFTYECRHQIAHC